MQSSLNIVFFLSLATGIYFFVDGVNKNHHDKDHQLSQTFRNVALLKDGSDLDVAENDLRRSRKIVSVVKGKMEAAEADIVKVKNVDHETKEMIYVQNSMEELYQHVLNSNQDMLEKKQLEWNYFWHGLRTKVLHKRKGALQMSQQSIFPIIFSSTKQDFDFHKSEITLNSHDLL